MKLFPIDLQASISVTDEAILVVIRDPEAQLFFLPGSHLTLDKTPVPKIEAISTNSVRLAFGPSSSIEVPRLANVDASFVSFFAVMANKAARQEQRISELEGELDSLRKEGRKLKRDLTNAVPVEMPVAKSVAGAVPKKGSSLLNPRVRKYR